MKQFTEFVDNTKLNHAVTFIKFSPSGLTAKWGKQLVSDAFIRVEKLKTEFLISSKST